MDYLKLQTNVPELIALEFADGRAVESKYGGDQVMFTLVDGRKAYLPPIVADKIAQAGIRPNEQFSICKKEMVHGTRRSVEYVIQTDLGAGAPTLSKEVAPAPATAAPMTKQPGQVQSNAAVRVAPSGAAVLPAPPTLESAAAAAMTLAGKAAIDAVLEVETYAAARGMTDFAFGAENLQKIMVSIYIDLKKGGRA